MRPASYSSYFAASLYNLGRYTEALDAGKESLSLYRPLFAEYPLVYTYDLQNTLHMVALTLDDLGRRDEASASRPEVDSLPI